MDERIKELLVDNKDIFSNGCTESNGEVYIHGSQDNLQKFAELLIKECANIARQAESDNSDDYKSGRIWASLDILEHFGVE